MLCLAGGVVIAVVVCWSQQVPGADGDEVMVEFEKHLQSRLLSCDVVEKGWPSQRVHDGVDTRCLAVSV